MSEKLTPQQQQAVQDRGGRLLVSAAAGSGKTKVLVDRLMRYLTDPVHPANIDQFLMITFTKAAASELRGKIAAKLSELVAADPLNAHLRRQTQRLYLTKISTVHGFCSEVLREYAYCLNIPSDFRVADENECNDLRMQLMEKLLNDAYHQKQEDPYFFSFVDTQGLGRDDRQVPEIVLQLYDSARCHLNPDQWLSRCQEQVSNQEVSDAADTDYGAFLMKYLRSWLELQICALEKCCNQASETEGFEKPAALLQSTITQLRYLQESETWDQIVQRREIDFGVLRFSKKCTDETLKERICAVRDGCKAGLKKRIQPFSDFSEQVLQDLNASADAVRGLISLVKDFDDAYSKAKASRRILDFSDLEHKMLELLLGKNRNHQTSAAEEISSRFIEVMVDEYQDSNEVQDKIYHALTMKRNNLFMVGDVKQSIYQFRLADPTIFLEKYQNFQPADNVKAGEDRKVVLSKNFRSSGGVLEACNDVFRTCMCPDVGGMYYGADESLYEGLPHVPLNEPEVELFCVDVQEQTYPEEAAFVVEHIQKMLREGTVRDGDCLRPVRPEDIVILLRSPGSAGVYYERALEKAGIRYTTGGGVDLLKTEEIGTLHSILQVIHNPRLDIPLVAALSSPAFGFTANDLAVIRGKHKIGAFYDALCSADTEKSRLFLEQLRMLRGAVRHFSLTRLLEQVLVTTNLEEIYAAKDDGEKRLNHLRSFYQLTADFEAAGNRDLGRFLEYLETISEKGLLYSGEESTVGCVTIMSIHKSKGLEFPVVYLCGLAREFNMESQRGAVLCHKSMGIGLFAVDQHNRLRYPTIAKRAIAAKIGLEALSEELRVLYVAMTRARDRLIMTYASNRLEKDLSEIVQRINTNGQQIWISEAVCPGDWVLLTALQKTEAGELFVLSGKPEMTASGKYPWKIRVVSGSQPEIADMETITTQPISSQQLQQIQAGLSFCYAHTAAMSAPSKLTATEMKGRYKDAEAAENTVISSAYIMPFRQPKTVQSKATEYGNVVHAVMQHIDYTACSNAESVRYEIMRLQQLGLLSATQAEMVDSQMIADFFATEIGKKLQHGQSVREFKFSILDDAAQLDDALAGEKILLQGVVDCALLEEDGITIIDFKTDYVTEATLGQKAAEYAPQVETYARAMGRIYEKPIKQRLLYFFHVGNFVAM